MPTTRTRTARSAFTLVELLVATALVVIILTILAVAFGSASASFSQLKAVGDLASKLRTTQDKLRADLESPHFDAGDSPAGQRLSDLRYDLLTPGGSQVAPPRAGYFRIEQATGSLYEGSDADRVIGTRATNHTLEFTVKRTGQTPDQLFTAQSPSLAAFSVTDTALGANQLSTNWARVRWQLGNPRVVEGVTVYTLYRSVRLLAPQPVPGGPALVSISAANPGEAELFSTTPVSPNPGPYAPHTLLAVTPPATRAASPITPYAFGQTHYGDDIVLSNVLSFEVKATWTPGGGTATTTAIRPPRTLLPGSVGSVIVDTTPPPGPLTFTNSEYPFDDLPQVQPGENASLGGQRIFDTWAPLQTPGPTPTSWNVPGSNDSLPLRIRITALQVKIRVFDQKTLLTRQISFIVQP